ncbi:MULTISPECIES: hypothetical protein [Streptomyces]|uniref:DUF3303 domain-containing protein n=3 Tax=Streptomyces TaxID=1883 RepID=A0A3Q9G1V5_STRLT|nr:hypothetical protein [Streptomyces luteoverticillatus]AZQ74058.1 hypothetical protein EKH77_25070 [Streptomyces luteoverticillatus]
MRMLLRARMDTHTSNAGVKDGSLPRLMEKIVEELKPEAAYFAPLDGGRSCLMVFDMQDSSQIVGIGEKLFQEADAEVELNPVMNLDDLKKGLADFTG